MLFVVLVLLEWELLHRGVEDYLFHDLKSGLSRLRRRWRAAKGGRGSGKMMMMMLIWTRIKIGMKSTSTGLLRKKKVRVQMKTKRWRLQKQIPPNPKRSSQKNRPRNNQPHQLLHLVHVALNPQHHLQQPQQPQKDQLENPPYPHHHPYTPESQDHSIYQSHNLFPRVKLFRQKHVPVNPNLKLRKRLPHQGVEWLDLFQELFHLIWMLPPLPLQLL
jgi:hypothetical protein